MSYYRSGRGLGAEYPQRIEEGVDPVAQPTSEVAAMTTMNINPMIQPGEYASGEQAMMLEMQARSSGDPGAFQPASLPLPGITSRTANTSGATQSLQPMQQQQQPIAANAEQLYKMLVEFWQAALAGRTPPNPGIIEQATKAGRGDLVGQAEQFVMSGGRSGGFVSAGSATTTQPSRDVTADVRILPATQVPVPVSNTINRTQPITNYIDYTTINPAQPSTFIPEPTPPPASKCPSGYSWVQGSAWVGCVDAAGNKWTGNAANDVGPISPPSPPETGYIPGGTPATGQIPMGPDATAQIPQKQLPPETQQYVSDQTKTKQYMPPPTLPQKETSYLPIIAVAVGAFLLAKML